MDKYVANLDDPFDVEFIENSQINKLVSAIEQGDVATVFECLEAGRDLSFSGDVGNTPLFVAMFENQPQLVKLLLEWENFDLAAVNYWGKTGLHLACWYGHSNCLP